MITNKHILFETIQKGEGISTEFKTCKSQLNRDVYETVCAFLSRHFILKIRFFREFDQSLTYEKGSEKMSEKMSEKILRLIEKNPAVSVRELAAIIEKTERTIERKIAVLKKQDKLKRIGPAKGGHWEIYETN